jgi:tRNA threonylcarbamoyladenosine biosynthesis protein TsaB
VVVLGLDTATRRGSIALARPGRILIEVGLEERAWHARDLLPGIDRLLQEQGLAPTELSGIGVTLGPGSFTGLRVGMATARGLGYSLDRVVEGLSTLEALARAAMQASPQAPANLCAVLDAGRGEVYAAMFRVEKGVPVRATEDHSWRPSVLLKVIPPGTCLVGDGVGLVLSQGSKEGVDFTAIDPCPLLAGAVALWSCGVIRPDSRYRPGEPKPNYIRPSDAEAARQRS